MYKIILCAIALSFAALACGPGPMTIPAGPATPEPQKQETKSATTPVPPTTMAPVVTPAATPKGEQTISIRERALSSAKTIVEQDSTFRFDGIKESLKLAGEKSLEEGKTWEFTYVFESRYPGYGERSGRVMAAVITPHKARIVVKGGIVTEALIDEQWDMLGQKMIERKGQGY